VASVSAGFLAKCHFVTLGTFTDIGTVLNPGVVIAWAAAPGVYFRWRLKFIAVIVNKLDTGFEYADLAYPITVAKCEP